MVSAPRSVKNMNSFRSLERALSEIERQRQLLEAGESGPRTRHWDEEVG